MQSRRDNYTAADIERYHNGNMPAEEAHALERAALDDPFLSDALDGYVHTNTPATDVAFLKQQIQRRSGKVVLLHNKKQRTFIGVAAMVVLLAGFGWMLYKLSPIKDQNIAIETEAPPMQKAPTLQQDVVTDTVGSPSAETIATAPTSDQEEKKAVTKNKEHTGEKVASTDLARLSNNPAAADTTFSNSHAMPTPLSGIREDAGRADVHVFKARVVDAHNNAVPYASVTDAKNNAVIIADASGTFSLPAPDSNVIVAVTASGFEQQQTTLNRDMDTETTIVLQRAANRGSEVVVTAPNKKIRHTNNVRLEAVEPLEGLNRFNTYVKQYLALPKEANETARTGEVVLRFDVDTAGNAVDMIIEKSLCAACDSAAVRLISGSKWKRKNKANQPKAFIRF